LLKEAWERYHLPIAVTEVHLHCTREEQMRWLHMLWNDANRLADDGVDIQAITAWALLGSFGWNRLLTEANGYYEPGVFDLNNNNLRLTALAHMITAYNADQEFIHPILATNGWWQHKCRVIYGQELFFSDVSGHNGANRPVLIIGKSSSLGNSFARICGQRNIAHRQLDRNELDITRPMEIEKAILEHAPWAIVNTAGFIGIDDAETQSGSCFAINTDGPKNLALLCEKYGVKLLTFSTDLVFNGLKTNPYIEADNISPLNIYGHSKAQAEKEVLFNNPSALVIRTSAFFDPWDKANFIRVVIDNIRADKHFQVANDVTVSPTYIPDLVNRSLDLMLDDSMGIWHLSNTGQLSWANLAYSVAERMGLNTRLIKPVPLRHLGYRAQRPVYSALSSEKGSMLPLLDDAIGRCIAEINNVG
jgi:dTDP-4-dehydrorhamnose reductase